MNNKKIHVDEALVLHLQHVFPSGLPIRAVESLSEINTRIGQQTVISHIKALFEQSLKKE